MPQGLAAEEATTLEVIAAWVTLKQSITAVSASPGWYVVGEYYLPKSTPARLEATLSVSDPALTARVRLWDVTAKAAVSGAISTQSEAPVRVLGGRVSLTGNRNYQVQVECTGGTGDDQFAVLESAGITD